jgi:hypothetical protein
MQQARFSLLWSLGGALLVVAAAPTANSAGPATNAPRLIDGPAGYTIACATRSGTELRACEDLPSARYCDSEANFASRPSTERTGMTFVNRSEEPVDIYWLNFQGARIQYQHLSPGGRFVRSTFVGHNWLVTNMAGQCIGIFKAAPESIAFF